MCNQNRFISVMRVCVHCQCVIIQVCVTSRGRARTECAGNELRHSNIMTTFHLIPLDAMLWKMTVIWTRCFKALGSLSSALLTVPGALQH